jgi:hypothetical protein
MPYQSCGLLENISQKKFLLEVYVRMVQPEENINYPSRYHQHELGKTLILDKSTNITIKNKQITGWTLTTNE